jgi:HK97 gp10 family phage protein
MAAVEMSVQIKGLKELGQALKTLPPQLERTALRVGAREAAKVLQDGMSRRAPRGDPEQPNLADEIVVTTATEMNIAAAHFGRVPYAKVGPSRRAFYALFLEFGTVHMAAQPFMRPTVESDGQIAVAAWASHARASFERSIKRLASEA